MTRKGSKMWVLILGVIIVVALFAVPSAIRSAQNAWSNFWSDFWAPFTQDTDTTDDVNDTNDTTTDGHGFDNGQAGMGIKIWYKDGTQTEFVPWKDFDFPMTLLPLTIYAGPDGKEVSSVTVSVYIQVETLYTVTSWQANGPIAATFHGPTNTWSYDSQSIAFSRTGLVSRNNYVIWSKTYQASDIDTFAADHIKYGSPPFSCTLTWQVTELSGSFTFTDGYTEQSTGHNAYVDWNFTYQPPTPDEQSRLESVSITVQAANL